MNESTQQLIRELADKLGTTTEHLWGVLVKQAPISGAIGLLSSVAMLAVVFFAWRKLTKIEFGKWDNDFGKGALYGGFCIATAIVFASTMGALPVEVAGIFNPEYWALKQVLR